MTLTGGALGGQKFDAAKTRVAKLHGSTEISARDRERYARARTRGQTRVEDRSAVVDARYDSDADTIELAFKGGGSMSIPRTLVPGLARASASKLNAVVVSADPSVA